MYNFASKFSQWTPNNPKNYTNLTFPPLASTTNTIYIKGSSDPNSPFYTTKNYVTVNFSIFGLPIVSAPEISSSLNSYIGETKLESYNNCLNVTIYFNISKKDSYPTLDNCLIINFIFIFL